MEVKHDETKIVVYDLMKFKMTWVKFGINKWWNIENITWRT
jgi:hypothetical protein